MAMRTSWWRQPQTRYLLLVLQSIVSIGLLAWLFYSYRSGLLAVIQKLSISTLFTATLILATSQLWGGLRLWLLSRSDAGGFSWLVAIRMTFAGFFVGSFLPSTVGGDIVRGLVMTRYNVRVSEAAIILLADRLINTIIILCLAVATVPTSFDRESFVDNNLMIMTGALFTMIGAMIAAPHIGIWLEGNPFGQSNRMLSGLTRGLQRFPRHTSVLLPAVILSFASVGASIAAQWLLIADLGIEITLIEFTAVICLVYLITLLPISLNGLGLQEAGLTALLVSLGADAVTALTFALAVRIIMIAVAGIGALALTGSWPPKSPPKDHGLNS